MVEAAQSTWGGMLLWTDVMVAGGWRIQRHAMTGEHRLLDNRDRQIAQGGLARCRMTMQARHLARYRAGDDHVVLLVHALGGWRSLWRPLEERLARAGYRVETFGYASTLTGCAHHAAALDGVIARLPGVKSLSFVTNSLGGRVVATALAGAAHWRRDRDVASIAMLAPPAEEVALARAARRIPPVRWLMGPALEELADHKLPTAGLKGLPVLVVAGEVGDGRWHPVHDGGHDGVLSLGETTLDIPHARVVVRATHGNFIAKPAVQAAVHAFLDGTRP